MLTDLFGLMISLLFAAVGWLAGYEYGIRRRK